jgi:hypothetical protein
MAEDGGASVAPGPVVALSQARRQVGDNPAFQHRVWGLQRIGWVVTALFVAGAFSGLLGGGGPLAKHNVTGAEGGLRVTYEAVVRQSRSTTWSVLLPAGTNSLTLPEAATYRFQPSLIVPRPIGERREAGALVMVFDRADESPMRVQLVLVPSGPGFHEVVLRAGQSRATLHLLSLP